MSELKIRNVKGKNKKIIAMKKRALRVRNKLKSQYSNNGIVRLSVYRSNKNISAQVIETNDVGQDIVLASSSSLDKDFKKSSSYGGNIDASRLVGTIIGKKIRELFKNGKINKIVFDRSGYLYHGRVKALADAVREQEVVL